MNLYIDTLAITQDTLAAISPSQVSVADSLFLSKKALSTIIEATKDEPSRTDWIQAVTALLGTLFALVTLWKLVSRNRENEESIAQLSSIASSQQEQITELRNQSNIMQSTLRVYESMLDNSTQAISLKKAEAEVKSKEAKEKSREDNEPLFEVQSYGANADKNLYTIGIMNNGRRAKNLRIVFEQKYITWYHYEMDIRTNMEVETVLNDETVFQVHNGQGFRLDGYVDSQRTWSDASTIDFELVFEYEDVLGHVYNKHFIKPPNVEDLIDEKSVIVS